VSCAFTRAPILKSSKTAMQSGCVDIPAILRSPLQTKGVSKNDLIKKLKKLHKAMSELPMPETDLDRPDDLDDFAASLISDVILKHKDKVRLFPQIATSLTRCT
jgi:hypothetical protein